MIIIGNTINSLAVTLAGHPFLRNLQLSDNPNFVLRPNDIPNLNSKSLRSLYLDGCNLTTIPNASFALLPGLVELNLERNHLKTIPVEILAKTNISRLSLSQNHDFNFIPNTGLLVSDTLTEFRCNGCGINVIYEATFAKLPSLRRIELNQNQITVVYAKAFGQLGRLAVLQLNQNHLATFPIGTLRTPPLLELCLDGNNFTSGTSTNVLKQRYVRLQLRGQCPANVSGQLDDIEDARLPGISDAFIASYLVLVVLIQGVLAALLIGFCLRQKFRSREPEEWDYAAGVLNDSAIYEYVK